ncbi:uncharacterized protein MKK02DRAFT_42741 [Dioszegia hungarica]|uniref:Cytidyltransferase-like domain-containing protein n=1 Tax=Dioszegia hungarica TaxID=4972 RepID=A0AA38LXY3_9TREE|nr:uncharacterized protein MKK02DRAFT_42741 [Dioszegia hungarica]KAI9638354.1 hypothetical protein MKK02DRAFT_42741 [Dioszegia hungarica]
MSSYETSLRSALSSMPSAGHVTLILPFTPALLPDPTPLLPIIFQALIALPEIALFVYFSTPPGVSEKHDQLYDVLSQNPRANFDVLQSFLAQVYATLAAGQWESGKVDVSVDVGFAGVVAGQEKRISEESELVLYLDDYEPAGILASTPNSIQRYSLPSPSFPSSSSSTSTFAPSPPSPGPRVVALGGTFDHLHAAHKLLLQLAHFLSTRKLIVGVMSDSLLSSKDHSEYIEPGPTREWAVKDFLLSLSGDGRAETKRIELNVLEIHDGFGPTRDEEDIQALVISEETKSGGEAVNALRKKNGLAELEVWSIDVISAGTLRALYGTGEEGEDGIVGLGMEGAGRSGRSGRSGRKSPEYGSEGVSSTKSGILKGLDEKRLKAEKMGSTAIRKRLAEGKAYEERQRSGGNSVRGEL